MLAASVAKRYNHDLAISKKILTKPLRHFRIVRNDTVLKFPQPVLPELIGRPLGIEDPHAQTDRVSRLLLPAGR